MVPLQFLLLGIVQHWFILLGVFICLIMPPAILLVPVPLVVAQAMVDVPLILVVEEVVDVLLVTMLLAIVVVVAVVVAHGSVLIVIGYRCWDLHGCPATHQVPYLTEEAPSSDPSPQIVSISEA